jgi:hypothetical protein
VLRSGAFGPQFDGWWPTPEDEFDDDVYKGLELLIAKLTSKFECKPGFKSKVKLPDLKMYQQVR